MKATACLRTVGGVGSFQGAGKRLFSSQQRVWPSSHDLPPKRPPGEDAETDRFISEMGRMELRPRIDSESKTIATPSGALPISPLMDERRLNAQRERRLPKPAPDRLRNGTFERRLEDNPYGQCLLGLPLSLVELSWRLTCGRLAKPRPWAPPCAWTRQQTPFCPGFFCKTSTS